VNEQRQALSAAEVARLFGVCKGTVYAGAKAGDLSSIRLRGRVLFPRSEILRLLHLYEGSKPEGALESMRQVAA
jgi:excisionase family DNA binding protein